MPAQPDASTSDDYTSDQPVDDQHHSPASSTQQTEVPSDFTAVEASSDAVPLVDPLPIEVPKPAATSEPALTAGSQVPLVPPALEGVVAGVRVADARKSAASMDPAEWGGRGRMNRVMGGLVRLAPKADELRHREEQVQVLRSFPTSQLVMVASPKGGAGKTPTTWGLAATLGFYRGGYVLAWDNNETRGTLGQRAEAGLSASASVVDLLGQIDSFLTTSASVGQLGAFVRPQSAHFDVLASDETPGRQQMIDGPKFQKLREALSRWYRFMMVDTGNNVRAANWWETVRSANGLVVPTTVKMDVANEGLWMLDHLQKVGADLLVRNAVVVVTCADPQVDQRLLSQIVDTYGERVREVVVIPFDPTIQPGTRLSYKDLAEPTRRAYLTAAAAVIGSLTATEKAIQRTHIQQAPVALVRGGGSQ